jgi:hypothetical protein
MVYKVYYLSAKKKVSREGGVIIEQIFFALK